MSNKILTIISLVVVFAAGVFAYFQLKGQAPYEIQPENNETTMDNQTQTPEAVCQRNYDEQKFKTDKVATKNQKVKISVKGFGEIVVALDDAAAPKTVENFLKLTNAGFYNCLTFHRLARDFVVQGGDPEGTGRGGPGFTVPAEIKLKHLKGSIAMARLGDDANPKRDSSGSQFYIALNDLPMLDGAYTVFGKVESGMDVVEKIGSQTIAGGGQDGPPQTPIVMESVTIVK